MGGNDYYKILEVHPEASDEVIKKAYQTLVQRYHPDRHSTGRRKWAEEHFKELSEAYQVLNDPVKRREYDSRSDSEELAKEPSGASAGGRGDEQAYFSYRIGLEHYQNAQKKAGWRILLGRVASDLNKARDQFVTVLDEYPNSKYAEDSQFYYICCLMECYDYSAEYFKETEEEFTEFLDEYPRSKWATEVKLRFAKFYLLKKRHYSKANELLSDILSLYHDTDIAEEAKILSDYAKELCGK